MEFKFPLFTIVFLIAIILLSCVHGYLEPPSRSRCCSVNLLMTAVVIWLFSRSLEAGAVNIGDKIFWGKMMFFGAVLTGINWLLFCPVIHRSFMDPKTRQYPPDLLVSPNFILMI